MKSDVWVDFEQRKPEPYQKVFMRTRDRMPSIEVGYYLPGGLFCWVFIDGIGETICENCKEVVTDNIQQNAYREESIYKWADYEEVMNVFKSII